jgi:histidine triad (HIT) family protein
MDDCIFCKIVKGELPCSKVYEDDLVLAFDDIKPAAPVHVVVISKEHIPTLMDVKDSTKEYVNAMMAAAPKIARIKGIAERGFRVMLNCNLEGGQVVFHLHLHVLGGKKLGCNPV